MSSFARRDRLLEVQHQAQAIWEKNKAFERDADVEPTPKFLCSFPYPYMNGFLHVGHAFTISKTEFATGYERLKGKNALFPFGFHCTGMPIQACANKLRAEMEMYGTPPQFPAEEEAEETKVVGKSKVLAKTGRVKRQWEILEQSGIPPEEIPKFADPVQWCRYFPREGMQDLKSFGIKTDWRRSFITTSINPYYDSFIRWQMNELKARGKVIFGKRHTIYSPMDQQACADHDRASGEGVQVQEYTVIKMRVQEPLPPVLASLAGKEVFLGAATLRPETMYGQTNCWALPDGDYGAYQLVDGTVLIMSERAAKNMAYQEKFPTFGEYVQLLTLKGTDLLGLPLEAPNAVVKPIYVLPLLTVSLSKGTGIVTSVPSDAPDDYRGLMDLVEKEALRDKFGVKEEWVVPFQHPVPIIETPGLGTLPAKTLCERYKIRSQNDKDALQKAKEEVYKKGFYEGKMIVGEHAGLPVAKAKPIIKQEMIERGQAFVYAEPESVVMSRSGDECVVALTDQWYLNYGEESWKALAEECLHRMNTYSSETLHGFESTLAVLHEWACARTRGLGTKLPWDPEWVVESLSDSTIYMAYYTVAHLLQGDENLDGSKMGPLGVTAEQMTDAAWSYVLLGKELTVEESAQSGASKEALEKLRAEFLYWYPLDLRVSGKDLITNHLTFFIYNHVAIFPEEHWPKAVRANGHILVNAVKMSKQTGNFITLRGAIEQYSADAVRLTLADAGDTVEDANFSTKTASDTAVLWLTTLISFVEDGLAVVDDMRTGPIESFADRVFEASLDDAVLKTEAAYSEMLYRVALKVGFYGVQEALGRYREDTGSDKSQDTLPRMHRELFLRFVDVQTLLLAPICPHTAEYLYGRAHNGASIMDARWPEANAPDDVLLQRSAYLKDVMHRMRVNMQRQKKGKNSTPAASSEAGTAGKIYVCLELPDWQSKCLEVLRECYNPVEKSFPKDLDKRVVAALPPELKKMIGKIMKFVGMVRDEAKEAGASALDRDIKFDEREVLEENMEQMKEQLRLISLDVLPSSAPQDGDTTIASDAVPLKPTFVLRSAAQ